MNTDEAVRRCSFWTTNEAETQAIGTTTDAEVGLFFDGQEHQREAWSRPGKSFGWSIKVPRWISGEGAPDEGLRIENLLYIKIVQEIERRRET